MTFFQYTYTLFILDGWMDLHHVFNTSMSLGSGAAGGYVEAGSAYASSPPSIPAFCALPVHWPCLTSASWDASEEFKERGQAHEPKSVRRRRPSLTLTTHQCTVHCHCCYGKPIGGQDVGTGDKLCWLGLWTAQCGFANTDDVIIAKTGKFTLGKYFAMWWVVRSWFEEMGGTPSSSLPLFGLLAWGTITLLHFFNFFRGDSRWNVTDKW